MAYGHAQHSDKIKELSWSSWYFQPLVFLCLLVLGLIYYKGYQNYRDHNKAKSKNVFSYYYLGLFTLAMALLSPIDAMSDALAWVHMLQHTLILMVAAPLMALGGPSYIGLWFLSADTWKKIHRPMKYLLSATRFNRPILAWLLYSVTLWIWHIPSLYKMALENEWIHDVQHLSFFISSFYFWRVLLDPFQQKFYQTAGILYAFVASLHGIILGVLMALSPSIWYRPYISRAVLFGYDPLVDQQLAGLIMWMPAGISYVVISLYLLAKLMRDKDQRES